MKKPPIQMKKTPIQEIQDSLRRSGKIPRNEVSSKADKLFEKINSKDKKSKENNKNNNSQKKSTVHDKKLAA